MNLVVPHLMQTSVHPLCMLLHLQISTELLTACKRIARDLARCIERVYMHTSLLDVQ